MKKNIYSQKIAIINNRVDPFMKMSAAKVDSNLFWRWGDDNLFPVALSMMSRRSTTHRRIINDKADYISGKGFTYDSTNPILKAFVECANGDGETLRKILNKVAFDKSLFGNAFVEIVTDDTNSFLAMFHQDASKCRVAKDRKQILMHHDWSNFSIKTAKKLPIFPEFRRSSNGTMRSIIHYKDYEPMFENYGVPPYIAGMNVSAIAYKTDKWNISRLDNSFQLSGVMLLDASVDSDEEANHIVKTAEKKFAGKPGQVMFMMKDSSEGDNSRFIPITASNEGDWTKLHDQATTDIIVAHSWFRSLSGLDYGAGFNSERILYEYEVALNTVILAEQEEIMEPIKEAIEMILKQDCSSLEIVNRPPAKSKPLYMKVWEARKADGLEYDLEDPLQQLFVAQITKYAMKNID